MFGFPWGAGFGERFRTVPAGGMCVWIYRFGHQYTVDAYITEYARAGRAGRSGHYFYETLVSVGYLLCFWALAECRKIGFSWDTDLGESFRTLPVIRAQWQHHG